MRAAWLRAFVGGCRVEHRVDPVAARRAARMLPKYPFQNTEYRRDQTGDIQRYFTANPDYAASLGAQDVGGGPIWINDLDQRDPISPADGATGSARCLPSCGQVWENPPLCHEQ